MKKMWKNRLWAQISYIRSNFWMNDSLYSSETECCIGELEVLQFFEIVRQINLQVLEKS